MLNWRLSFPYEATDLQNIRKEKEQEEERKEDGEAQGEKGGEKEDEEEEAAKTIYTKFMFERENKKMFDSYLKYSGNISDTPIYHTVLNYHYVCFYFPYKTMSL